MSPLQKSGLKINNGLQGTRYLPPVVILALGTSPLYVRTHTDLTNAMDYSQVFPFF